MWRPVSTDLELPFQVANGDRLTEITIWSDACNSWVWFEAELTDAADNAVVAFEGGVAYYKGSDWSEGSQRTRTRMRIPPGNYTLSLKMTEAEVDWPAAGLPAGWRQRCARVSRIRGGCGARR